MDKRNLSRFYTKKIGVKQALEEMRRPEPLPLARPVSAGGVSQSPATLSQEYLQFALGIDEVPPWMRDTMWALVTRMNNLTIIDGDMDFERLMHGVRAMLRAMLWERKITLNEMTQIEYYVGVQLRRSRGGKQLTLVSPGYQKMVHEEVTSKETVIDGENQPGHAAAGFLNRGKGGGRF